MSEQIKINEEETSSIRTLQGKFQENITQFGRLYLEKMTVEATIKAIAERENQLQDNWKSLQKEESELLDTILKKYGEGNLDLANGVFIPSKK